MKACALFLFLLGSTMLIGQNLVPDASFEDYNRLPCSVNEFLIQDLLRKWLQPIPATTDYWNSLSDPDCFLNPMQTTVSPRTGNGMIGLITAVVQDGSRIQYKEYVEAKLNSKLKKGTLYNVEFYAHNRVKSVVQSDILAANNLGAAFTDSLILHPVSRNAPDHLLLDAAIKENEPIGMAWQKVHGCFLATSASQYVLIGNFNSIDSTKLVQITNGLDDAAAYYFIDDVLVEELPYDVSALAATATLCAGEDFVQLNAFVEGARNYQWDGGSQGPTINASTKEGANYSVEISFDECQYKHTFHVTYVPDIDLGTDTTLCIGEELRLSPTHPTNAFLWSDGSSDSIKNISVPGTYAVSIPSENCNIQDSIEVSFIDCPGYVPNIITPNNDAYNEYFVFENIENRSWSLSVINKWGEQVYFSAHYKNNWNGNELPDGIYYYLLSSTELHKTIKGWVNLVH